MALKVAPHGFMKCGKMKISTTSKSIHGYYVEVSTELF